MYQGGWEGGDDIPTPRWERDDDGEMERELIRTQRRETVLQEQLVAVRAELDAAALHGHRLEKQLQTAEQETEIAYQRIAKLENALTQRNAECAHLQQAQAALSLANEEMKSQLQALQADNSAANERLRKEQADAVITALELEAATAESKRLLARESEREEMARELTRCKSTCLLVQKSTNTDT